MCIRDRYRIDSGKTNEYHAINSPNANKPNPIPTASVPFCFPSMYETIVSIEPYTSKIKENDLMICSMFIVDKKNNGSIPIDLNNVILEKMILLYEKMQ